MSERQITKADLNIMLAAQMIVEAVERVGIGTLDQFAAFQRDIARLEGELAEEKARSARLLKVAKYSPGYGWNARSFKEREAVRDCEEHGDFGDRSHADPAAGEPGEGA